MLEAIIVVVFIATFVLLLVTINRVVALEAWQEKAHKKFTMIGLLLKKYPGLRTDVQSGDVVEYQVAQGWGSYGRRYGPKEYGSVSWNSDEMYFYVGTRKLDEEVLIVRFLNNVRVSGVWCGRGDCEED